MRVMLVNVMSYIENYYLILIGSIFHVFNYLPAEAMLLVYHSQIFYSKIIQALF